MLIVAQDVDCVNVQWGGRGCRGDDCRAAGGWTDIVVRKDAMLNDLAVSRCECCCAVAVALSHIPGVSIALRGSLLEHVP